MRFYVSGKWGFKLVWGLYGSVFPLALSMAVPNAVITFIVCTLGEHELYEQDGHTTNTAMGILSTFSACMFFILNFRSKTAYGRWWEGGTLLQQTRGEWFNGYSSLLAFCNPDPSKHVEVECFQHLIVRLMSMLYCFALQQVSPDKDRAFEIFALAGCDEQSLEFLQKSNDKVEVVLQWVQRSITLGMQSGVISVAPPVVSRAYQELSRGIVNLQNARKIADFPFPYPYAQASMVMLCIHWAMVPVLCSMLLGRWLAVSVSFLVIFFLWCHNFIALQLEAPFGNEPNDLPMDQMMKDWNTSLRTLMANRAQKPPRFDFDGDVHRKLTVVMSDGSPCDNHLGDPNEAISSSEFRKYNF
eukprot:gb/GFBE01083348.1/.p1 GENE.gb/GFBE01083348.1/~~gb/GFBE01083348.1/.p1  ORF type:complete len:357 (+),score=47.12 gb/GFBE01083348.1/:1-1071(+)